MWVKVISMAITLLPFSPAVLQFFPLVRHFRTFRGTHLCKFLVSWNFGLDSERYFIAAVTMFLSNLNTLHSLGIFMLHQDYTSI